MNHKIGLVEALCGFQFMLKHLDGRQIVVKYPAGKVIEPGEPHSYNNLFFFYIETCQSAGQNLVDAFVLYILYKDICADYFLSVLALSL